jgi:hypothetical protein
MKGVVVNKKIDSIIKPDKRIKPLLFSIFIFLSLLFCDFKIESEEALRQAAKSQTPIFRPLYGQDRLSQCGIHHSNGYNWLNLFRSGAAKFPLPALAEGLNTLPCV